MKRILATLSAMVILGGCSPRSTVIPTDPSKWDTISNASKQLSEKDRARLASYLMRQSLAGALTGRKASIPPGTTIGQALDDQTKFEEDSKKQEADADLLKAKATAQRAAAAAALGHIALVTLVSKTYLPSDAMAGRFGNHLQLVIAVQNRSAKDIAGIKGAFQFDDMFGSKIEDVGMSMDRPVTAGAIQTFDNYSIDINQFENNDTKLAVTDLSKMKVTFEPEMIVFADGTKMGAPDSGDGSP